MRKFKLYSYLIPILSLIFFVIVMQGGVYYLTSWPQRNIIPEYVKHIESDINEEKWDKAKEDLIDLDLAWKKAIPRIQYHAEMDAIDDIKENIARLSGSIEAKDRGLALAELSELSEHWENLKN